MAEGDIRQGMQVLGSDGGMVGAVAGRHDDHIHVRPTPPVEGGTEFLVPREWVARVDEHVHLDRPAALVRETWRSSDHPAPAAGAAAASRFPDDYHGVGKSWVVWAAGAILLLLVVVLGVRAFVYGATDPEYSSASSPALTDADRAASGAVPDPIRQDVETHLRAEDSGQRSFTFANLRFDRGSAELRSEHREELAMLGRTLAAYPDARFRIVGFADAGGDNEANRALGKRRAEAVAAALIANGVNSAAIETVSASEAGIGGGDRRTRLIVLAG